LIEKNLSTFFERFLCFYDKKEGYQTNLEDRKSHELCPIGKQSESALLYDDNKGGAQK